MAGRLDGRVAVVTGGSRGIGEAIATAFAAEGARVVVASRKEPGVAAAAARINALHPGSTVPMVCHVGKLDTLAGFISNVCENVGLPDILVNNAGTNPYFGPMLGLEWAAWDKTFDVNVKGPFELTRQVSQRLLAAGRQGSIIHISSIFGQRASMFQGIYGMTKASLISMTRTLAVELGAGGIRVNAIAPGLIETRLSAAITSNDDLVRGYTDRAAMSRYGAPSEIAGAAVWLASDESSFVTGQTITVDGGYTIA
jgi:NAD(P)-dependent dehydrogenase (short-subunit alcohol dehydrogenase family)